jgi:hypothetical protein
MLCFEVEDVLFYGLETSPLAWTSFKEAKGKNILQLLIKENYEKNSSNCKILTFLVI